MKKNDESWFCCDCKVFGDYETLLKEHYKIGHKIKKKIPLEKRFVHQNKGNIHITLDNQTYGILPILVMYKNPYSDIPRLSDPFLSLQSTTKPLKFNGYAVMKGSLENISKKMSKSCGYQSKKISPKTLEELIKNAIRNGKAQVEESGIVKVYLARNTSLKLQPKNDNSHWVITNPNLIRQTFQDPEEARHTALQKARPLDTRQAVGM